MRLPTEDEQWRMILLGDDWDWEYGDPDNVFTGALDDEEILRNRRSTLQRLCGNQANAVPEQSSGTQDSDRICWKAMRRKNR